VVGASGTPNVDVGPAAGIGEHLPLVTCEPVEAGVVIGVVVVVGGGASNTATLYTASL
jgi:hypothetical protein